MDFIHVNFRDISILYKINIGFIILINQPIYFQFDMQLPMHFRKMFASCKILRTESTNIHFNLATEQYLFQTAQLNHPTLFIWRNSPTIVIGRHQNPWKQCRNQLMKQEGVLLSRRKTGGGAVYHDLGNVCFSFLTPYQKDQSYDYKTTNNQILIKTFSKLGVPAEVSGRNDITCLGRKISGSAYRLYMGGKQGTGRKALHHGTVLFSVDLQALQRFLNPNKKKLESKGIDSIVSRVMNLTQNYPSLNQNVFSETLEKEFADHYGGHAQRQILQFQTERKQNSVINANYERLRSWEWLYGQCPDFKYSIDRKFVWGLTEVSYNVVDGVVKEGKIYSDCLYPDFITAANQQLVKGIKYDKDGIKILETNLLARVDNDIAPMVRELCTWMTEEL